MARVSEQGVGGVFFESQGVVPDDAAIEVGADEGEEEDGGEHSSWRCAAQLFDAGPVQEGADLEVVEKGSDMIGNLSCLLLSVKKVCTIHGSLFFLILLKIFGKPNIPESKRLFTLKMQNFH